MALTTRTVTVVELNPGAEARPGKQMPIRLNVGGWTDGGTKRILDTFYPKTAADGSLSVDLVPNSLIDPAGTYYTISEGRNSVVGFVVPAGSGTISLYDCLVDAPPNTDPVQAGVGQAAFDARTLTDVATTVTANGALVVNRHNPVDATSGNRTMTLADAASAGQVVAFSKKDATANTVALNVAHLRDTGAGTITLAYQYESIVLVSKADGTWWPFAAHRTKSTLDTAYDTRKALARNPDVLVTGTVTRDTNGAATSAPVTWPDGSPGTYTADTVSTAFPGAVDAYHITYGSPVTKTYTQPVVTRDANGAATNVPAIVVS